MYSDIPLVSFVRESVAAPAGLIVLLQHQNPFPSFRHDSRRGQATDTTADHDSVKAIRYLLKPKIVKSRK